MDALTLLFRGRDGRHKAKPGLTRDKMPRIRPDNKKIPVQSRETFSGFSRNSLKNRNMQTRETAPRARLM